MAEPTEKITITLHTDDGCNTPIDAEDIRIAIEARAILADSDPLYMRLLAIMNKGGETLRLIAEEAEALGLVLK